MNSIGRIACWLWLPMVLCAGLLRAEDFPLVVSDDPLTPQEQLKKFHLPPGFEIQLVAAEPDVRKPINLSFDHAGRLFFSQSIEYPFAAKEGTPPRDTVRVIEGLDADGKATKVRVAVEGLNIPIGVLPLHDRVLVFSIPNIYSCRDEDGDGVYEKREILFGPFDQRDTHGLNNHFTRGLDGWIYACHGFANDSHVKGRDGNEVHMNSGNTYRFRVDGSRIEHYTHGQVNPFGLCFDPRGNLFSADCHTLPAYMLLHGAFYPSFGKPHDGLGFGPEIMHHSHGSTAISGIVYYAAEQFPTQYRDTLFIGNPVTHRVNHDKLEWHGSTPVAIEQPDFLSCDDPWFRPVDLTLGPDGALYIADFYNRIIGHYEVDLHHPGRDRERGRIWRVVYRGTGEEVAEPPVLPDLTKLQLEGLVERLGDGNSTVRTMATHEMIDRFAGEAATRLVQLLKAGKLGATARSHAAYILAASRMTDEVLELLKDQDPAVRIHSLRALAGYAKAQSRFPVEGTANGWICAALEDTDPTVRRVAAECFGGLSPGFALPLASAWKSADSADMQLIHALRIALRDCFAMPDAYKTGVTALVSKDPVHRAHIADISPGIPSAESAAFVLSYLQSDGNSDRRFDEMLAHSVRYLPSDRLHEAFELASKLRGESSQRQRAVLVALNQALLARGTKAPDALVGWAVEVTSKLLTSQRERDLAQGIDLAREMKLSGLRPALERIAIGEKFDRIRPAAIDACVACDAAGSVEMLTGIMASATQAMPLRQKAAQALGLIGNGAARHALLQQLSYAPAQLEGDVATGLASNAEAAGLLLDAIEAGKGSAQVLRNAQVAQRLKQIRNDALQARIAKLTERLPAVDERIRNLIASRITGFSTAKVDISAGKQVFTKTCAACHKIGGEGQKIGPELDGIGNRGADRVIEDVLDPNRNVDQAFRTALITTDEGQSLNGLVLREEGKILVLADNQGKEVRVPLDKVLERTVSPLSPMPANVAEQLSEQDFYQLVGFLLTHDRNQAASQSATGAN